MNLKHLCTNLFVVFVLGLGLWSFAVRSVAQTTTNGLGTVLVLDASGSMEGRVDDRTKTSLARDASIGLVEDLVEKGSSVGLVTFGDTSATCQSARVAVPMLPGRLEDVVATIERVRPQYRAQTPLLDALQLAAEQAGPDGHVIAITDGIDTCQLNPCDLPPSYFDAKTSLVLVGLDVADEEESNLECLAEAADGTYLSANSELELVTLAEVTSALVTVSSKLRESRAEVLRDNQNANSELLKVQLERDRAVTTANEMRDRQQALVGLIDELKADLSAAEETTLLTDEQIVNLRQQYNELEDLNARQQARIGELEADLVASFNEYKSLEATCEQTQETLFQCNLDLANTGELLAEALKDIELKDYAFSEAFLIAEDERLGIIAQLDLARQEVLAAEEARDMAQQTLEVRNNAFSEFATSLVGLRKSEEGARLASQEDQKRRVQAESALQAVEANLAAKISEINAQARTIASLEQTVNDLREQLSLRETEVATLGQTLAQIDRALDERAREYQQAQEALRQQTDTQLAESRNAFNQMQTQMVNERDALQLAFEQDKATLNAALAASRADAERVQAELEQRFSELSAIYAALKDEVFSRDAAEQQRLAETMAEMERLKTVLDQVRADQSRLRALLSNQDPSYSSISADLRRTNRELNRCLAEMKADAEAHDLMVVQIEEGQSDIDALEIELSEQDLLIDDLINQQLACALPVQTAEDQSSIAEQPEG